MYNGFEHITITKEKEKSHLGGTDKAEYNIDGNYFNGKYIILFDDVVTRGRSMQEFKQLLENRGATIICALSIGRTYSDYYGEHREPHPWTNEY
jgi:predicted amidophosphoribosyltransferase